MAQIATPRLDFLEITYLCRIGFQIPQLFQFIDRSTNFNRKLSQLTHAQILIEREALFSIGDGRISSISPLGVYISCECEEIDCHVSHMTQMLSQSSTIFSNIKSPYISCPLPPSGLELEDTDPIPWPELFRPFIAIQMLHVDGYLTGLTTVRVVLEPSLAGLEIPAEVLLVEDEHVASGRTIRKSAQVALAHRTDWRGRGWAGTRTEFRGCPVQLAGTFSRGRRVSREAQLPISCVVRASSALPCPAHRRNEITSVSKMS